MKLKIYKSLFDETTLKDINTWVDKHTDGLIKKILAQIEKEDMFFLINALVFDAQKADFSKMSQSSGLFIGDVLHKTFINVDESGTKAAAVTKVS